MTTYEPELIELADGDDITEYSRRGLGDGLPLVPDAQARARRCSSARPAIRTRVLFTSSRAGDRDPGGRRRDQRRAGRLPAGRCSRCVLTALRGAVAAGGQPAA